MSEPVIVDLLRHGEVEGPVSVARGSGTEAALTEAGWRQMRAVGSALKTEGTLTGVAASPMSRCALYGEEICRELALPLHRIAAMREIDFGAWEGKQGHEIAEQELLVRFMENPDGIAIPGGESVAELSDRVVTAWRQWLLDASGEHRLLIAHGLVIRVLLAELLGQPLSHIWRLSLPYGAWCRVSLLEGEQPRLLFLNREVAGA